MGRPEFPRRLRGKVVKLHALAAAGSKDKQLHHG